MSQVTLEQALQIAIQRHTEADLQQAEHICRQILQLQPGQPEATYLLGLVALDTGHFAAAEELLCRSVVMMPRFAGASYKLGVALTHLGRDADAITALRRAVEIDGHFPQALTSLSMLLRKNGRLDEALAGFAKVVEAVPNQFEAHNNLGIALAEQNRLDEAAASMCRALQFNPDSIETHCNLGKVLARQQKMPEAIDCFQKAISLKADYPDAHCDMGVALIAMGLIDLAIAEFQQAVRLEPESANARWREALALLLIGDWTRGWKGYECRWLAEGFTSPRRNFIQPLWQGEDLAGRTILLHAEQGFGDTLQFIRYAELVAARGACVVVECPGELRRLLASASGISQLISYGEPLPLFDLHCPLMSLPGIFGTTIETIPASVQYLKPDPHLVESWRDRLGDSSIQFRVGLAWAGRHTFEGETTRSLHFSALAPLAAVCGVHFYSLQKGPPAEQANTPPDGLQLTNLGPELCDFADTAAVMSLMDLIISTDTSVPHLAGALGRPTWVMLQFVPDWRWLLEREDSPWYPTMKLFRQKSLGDWPSVIDRIVEALREAVNQPLKRPAR